jgi:hypothetical protein
MTEMFGDNDQQPKVEIKVNEDGSFVVGDKFFKDAHALAEAKAHADAHIKQIQNENKVFRDKVDGARSTEELFAEFERKITPHRETQVEQQEQHRETQAIDQEKLEELINQKVQERIAGIKNDSDIQTKAQALAQNAKKVRETLIRELGSEQEARQAWEAYKASPGFDSALAEQQMFKTPEDLATVVLARVGKPKLVDFSNTKPDLRTEARSPVTQPGWSHYKKLMLETPKEYYSPKVQVELKQATEAWRSAGKDFYSN